MGRWLPKDERDKRDEGVVTLYQQGLPYSAIVKKFGLSSNGDVGRILKNHGVIRNRTTIER